VRSRHPSRQKPLPTPTARSGLVVAGLSSAALLLVSGSAQAQGFFDSLFGRRWTAPHAYADPNAQWNPFGWGTPETPRPEGGSSLVFCVRLCDGRFFPMQRHAGIGATQACSAFCPTSRTRIFHGSNIEHAVAADGKRYGELASAFVYRDKIVPDCTCNGKNAFGIVHAPVEDDPTLQPGDIVATNTGLMAYNGGGRRQTSSFTPIESYAGVSEELRRRLTSTKITPAAPAPVAMPQIEPAEDKPADRAGRKTTQKRAQVER
jgi:Protein of unknown function (DUF2865)